MHIGELPMIIFTVVAQMSVGAFWILGLIQLIGRRSGMSNTTIDRITNAGMYAAGPLLLFGFFAAFFHLNDPFHAPFTLLHIGSSWLSRELISGVLYAGLGACFAIAQWFNILSRTARDTLAGLTALAGLALIISMTGVYYFTETVPAWHNIFTWVSFFSSAFFTGSLAVALALFIAWSMQSGNAAPARKQVREPARAGAYAGTSSVLIDEGDSPITDASPNSSATQPAPQARAGKKTGLVTKVLDIVKRGVFPDGQLSDETVTLAQRSMRLSTAIAAIAGIVLMVAYPFYMTSLGLGSEVERTVAHHIASHGYLAMRLVSLAVVVVLIVLVVRKQLEKATSPSKPLVWLLAGAFVLAVLTELLGRGLHYEGLVRVGINTIFG